MNAKEKSQTKDEMKYDVTPNTTDAPAPAHTKYGNIRRMLGTLDRFLAKKLGLVLMICAFGALACSAGLLFGAGSSASGGTGGTNADTLSPWLWAGVALFAFLGILAVIYVLGRGRKNKRNS